MPSRVSSGDARDTGSDRSACPRRPGRSCAERLRGAARARRGVHLQPLPVRPPRRVAARAASSPTTRNEVSPPSASRPTTSTAIRTTICHTWPSRPSGPVSGSRTSTTRRRRSPTRTAPSAHRISSCSTPTAASPIAASSTARGPAAASPPLGSRCGRRSTTCLRDSPSRHRTGRVWAARSSGDRRPEQSSVPDEHHRREHAKRAANVELALDRQLVVDEHVAPAPGWQRQGSALASRRAARPR